jgi:hypothetical protein
MSHLLVIEAPGKLHVFARHLNRRKIAGRVIASRGHVMEHPGLFPVGVTAVGEETGRLPSPQMERIVKTAAGQRVVLAMDADDEGDVIARDIARAVAAVAESVERMRVSDLSPSGFDLAWAGRTPADISTLEKDAEAGDARRLFDRLVSSSATEANLPVGRCVTPAIARLAESDPVVGEVVFVSPAQDDGQPWRAVQAVRASEIEVWEARSREWVKMGGSIILSGLIAPSGPRALADTPLVYSTAIREMAVAECRHEAEMDRRQEMLSGQR